MNKRDSKLIVLQFNEYINRQDIEQIYWRKTINLWTAIIMSTEEKKQM